MSKTKIYLELSDEILGVFADNGLNIEDILQQEAIEAAVTYGIPLCQSDNGARSKDVVTIILASSIAIPAIGFAISQILNTLHNKPYFIEYYEPVEILDKEGQVLKDDDGKPLFKVVKRHELLEPKTENQKRAFEASFNLTNGLMIKFGTQEKE